MNYNIDELNNWEKYNDPILYSSKRIKEIRKSLFKDKIALKIMVINLINSF